MGRLQPLEIEQTETVLNQKSVKYPLLSPFSRFTVRCLLLYIAGETSLARRILLETCWPHKNRQFDYRSVNIKFPPVKLQIREFLSGGI